jgi:hypothetical protein
VGPGGNIAYDHHCLEEKFVGNLMAEHPWPKTKLKQSDNELIFGGKIKCKAYLCKVLNVETAFLQSYFWKDHRKASYKKFTRKQSNVSTNSINSKVKGKKKNVTTESMQVTTKGTPLEPLINVPIES